MFTVSHKKLSHESSRGNLMQPHTDMYRALLSHDKQPLQVTEMLTVNLSCPLAVTITADALMYCYHDTTPE